MKKYLNWQTKKTNSTGKIVFGTVLGLAAGFTAGMLTAPRAGRETRDILTAKTNETLEKVGGAIAENKEKVSKNSKEQVDKLADKLN
ncbi:MAG TPA: YtxH domain-containing protein [Desulfopila sp.]|nr:YtxH domain-containing protein [Desulfopila sp.]